MSQPGAEPGPQEGAPGAAINPFDFAGEFSTQLPELLQRLDAATNQEERAAVLLLAYQTGAIAVANRVFWATNTSTENVTSLQFGTGPAEPGAASQSAAPGVAAGAPQAAAPAEAAAPGAPAAAEPAHANKPAEGEQGEHRETIREWFLNRPFSVTYTEGGNRPFCFGNRLGLELSNAVNAGDLPPAGTPAAVIKTMDVSSGGMLSRDKWRRPTAVFSSAPEEYNEHHIVNPDPLDEEDAEPPAIFEYFIGDDAGIGDVRVRLSLALSYDDAAGLSDWLAKDPGLAYGLLTVGIENELATCEPGDGDYVAHVAESVKRVGAAVGKRAEGRTLLVMSNAPGLGDGIRNVQRDGYSRAMLAPKKPESK